MKRIVVMGGTSGIGLAVVERLASDGMMVGVAGRKDDVMKELADRYPDNVRWEHIDITRDDATERLHKLIRKTGGMDCYFHVAGIGYENDALHAAKEIATLKTNVIGFTRMIDSAFRYFRDKCGGKGHIAAVTSVAGTKGIGHLAAYSASKKFGQTYLTALNQLATIQHLDIRFTDIRPGWIRTPLLDPDQNYPMIMQVGYALPKIVRALKRRARVAVIDWRWNLLVGLWRLVPNALWVKIPMPVESIASPSQAAGNLAEETAAAEVTPAPTPEGD